MNRAFEFLGLALEELKAHKVNREQVALYIRLAVPEIQELVDRLALADATDHELTRRIEARGAGPVLVADAQPMTPAFLTARPRAVLPGNGKGL